MDETEMWAAMDVAIEMLIAARGTPTIRGDTVKHVLTPHPMLGATWARDGVKLKLERVTNIWTLAVWLGSGGRVQIEMSGPVVSTDMIPIALDLIDFPGWKGRVND